jgi:hypothetical protein
MIGLQKRNRIRRLSVMIIQGIKTSRTVGIFAAFIQFKLNPKESWAISEENGRGLVVVIVDGLLRSPVGLIAGPAQGIIFVVINIPLEKQSAAVVAAGVVGIIATVAQRDVVGPIVVFSPDPLAAVMAEYGEFLQTVRAEELILKINAVFCGEVFSAVGTNFFLIHVIPPK